MGNERCIHGFGGETRGKEPLRRPAGWIILKWILKKGDGEALTVLLLLRIVTGECGNETSVCIKCGQFFLLFLKIEKLRFKVL
jgi:hypothetical protein